MGEKWFVLLKDSREKKYVRCASDRYQVHTTHNAGPTHRRSIGLPVDDCGHSSVHNLSYVTDVIWVSLRFSCTHHSSPPVCLSLFLSLFWFTQSVKARLSRLTKLGWRYLPRMQIKSSQVLSPLARWPIAKHLWWITHYKYNRQPGTV
jgi:hypothetical protein